MQALNDAIKNHGQVLSGENYPNVRCIPLSQWRESCDGHGLSDTDDRDSMRKAFNRNKAKLMEKNLIRIYNGFVWNVRNDDD